MWKKTLFFWWQNMSFTMWKKKQFFLFHLTKKRNVVHFCFYLPHWTTTSSVQVIILRMLIWSWLVLHLENSTILCYERSMHFKAKIEWAKAEAMKKKYHLSKCYLIILLRFNATYLVQCNSVYEHYPHWQFGNLAIVQ